MTAGYSPRTLVEKLGIKPHSRIALLNAPRGYAVTLRPLPPGLQVTASLRGTFPFIQFFTTSRRDLERRFPILVRALAQDGALWISWPKKTAGMDTDLTEDVIRAVALAARLVDVKVCAVDDVWSGLKLVRRKRDRARQIADSR
jgi:hypothetical protein